MKLEQKLAQAKTKGQVTRQIGSKLTHANKLEQKLVILAIDVKTMLQWMSHDVLELAGPLLVVRQELFDFIVAELKYREIQEHPQILKLRKSLHNQRDQLLAFAGILDQKLVEIALCFDLPLQKVRDVCLLNRKQPTSNAY